MFDRLVIGCTLIAAFLTLIIGLMILIYGVYFLLALTL